MGSKIKNAIKKSFIFFSILGIVVALNPIGQTASAACEDFYKNNNILMYNPCVGSTVCSANPGVVGSQAISTLRGTNNGEKIYNFWLDAGMTPAESAGITANLKEDSNFSAFRQEEGQSWPNGNWGVAQFNNDRQSVVSYLKDAVDVEFFDTYYSDLYGGAVDESTGFVPSGVPQDVNNAFLLGQLNYLLQKIQSTVPEQAIRDAYNSDFNKTIGSTETIYEHIKTLTQPADAAVAWTYLYKTPSSGVKEMATQRAQVAQLIMQLFSTGNNVTTDCGGSLSAGGMTLEEAITFVNNYKNNPSNVQYIGTAAKGCNGGPLSNCVSFSMYFINKYTTINGRNQAGNGSLVVANLVKYNPVLNLETGHSPRPYAVFSTASGSQWCGSVKCGHTGVILGVDTERGKVIVGEAGCSNPASWDTAREYDLSKFDSHNYTYLYTDGFLKGAVQ